MRPDLNLDYSLLIPELLLFGLALGILFIDLMTKVKKEALPYITVAGLIIALVASLFWLDTNDDFAGLIRIDDYTTFFRVFFIGTSIAIVLMSAKYVELKLRHPGEYYALIVISTIGAIYMAAAQELLTAYVALEVLSFSLYVLVSYAKRDPRSNEAGMKYMLLGAFASALLLYGISFIYGAAGSTTYGEIAAAFEDGVAEFEFGMLAGLTLIVAGLGFKVAAVPFHAWTPDAYHGAPLPITAYLSATSKAAGFALLLRLLSTGLLPVIDDWRFMIAVVAAITMVAGNLIAMWQTNIKRLLAYSSIGQVGYLLMGLVALSPEVTSAMLLHMVGYIVTTLAAFTAIVAYHNQTDAEELTDFRGMSDRAPLLAMITAVSLFSLAGLPLFAGFFTKFVFFASVTEEGYLWLASVAVLSSFISLYYYLIVLKAAYIDPTEERPRLKIPVLTQAIAVALTLGVFFVGLYPTPLFEVTDSVAKVLFPS
jgi:NADH-quinone oxidoreductase subunit N